MKHMVLILNPNGLLKLENSFIKQDTIAHIYQVLKDIENFGMNSIEGVEKDLQLMVILLLETIIFF